MCCEGSGNNCNCGCDAISLPSIAGPTGPTGPAGATGATGPAGTTILDWYDSTITTPITGSDVLMYSYTLLADELPTNGDELQIDVVGAWLNSASRYLKLDINGSTITTMAQCAGVCSNGIFVVKAIVSRVSNTSTEGFVQSFWNNGATVQSLVTFPFITDFTSNQTVRFYVNQDLANAIRIDSIKIKKAVH